MGGKFTKNTIERITSSSDIVAVVSEYTKLQRRSGNDWWGCCPFHGEKTASFHVDGDKKFYNCFGCHKGGNVISFLMEMEKTSFYETVLNLGKRFGIEIQYENGSATPEDYKPDNTNQLYIELYDRTASMFNYMLLETPQGKFALEYALKRGLTRETIEKFKLGYAPADRYWLKKFLKSKNYSDEFLNNSGLFSKKFNDITLFSDRLMFPIFGRKGQVVAFSGRILHEKGENDRKYINSPELPHYKKRETLFAFNFAKSAIRTENKAIVCEGNMDCIAYHQCGIEYAVAPLGTAFTEEQVKMLSSFADTILLSFDSDKAGLAATKKAILMCRKNNLTVKVIQLKGGKDPAEIMINLGKENLTAQVNNAIFDSDFFLIKLGEKYRLNTPEGKAKAALEYFEYVDSLQSDIQKESCLEQLSQTFNLKPEAVKRDFINRNQTIQRYNRQENPENNQQTQIKQNAELRGLLSVTADLDQFKTIRSELEESDFNNPAARKLYKILDDCLTENTFSIPEILTKCDDTSLTSLITDVISSGVYQKQNVSAIVNDTIKMMKKNKIEEQRNKILQRIKTFQVVTKEDQAQFDQLLLKKMELDKQVQLLK